jgi:hypothetical protein
MADAVFLTVVLLRFLVPLLIPRYPLPAILACLVIDAVDQTIFQAFTDDPLEGYQTYDKALDVYYLAIAYISTMGNWDDPVAFEIGRFLYFYRLTGVVLFEVLGHRWLLLVFPNTFEYFFIAYEAIRVRWNPRRLSAVALVIVAAAIWIFIKLPQETWIHVAQLDVTEFMADHPEAWGVVAAAAAVLAVLAAKYRRRLPTADWPWAFNVTRHLPVRGPAPAGPERFWTTVLLEKALFLGLVCVIFAHVLPDVRSGDLGILLGGVVLVVLNAGVSQALRRRGRSWANAARQFGAMLIINGGIVTIDAIFSSGGGADAPALNTVFFVVLLSLLIALYDRFRATRPPQDHPTRVWATFRAERAAASG